MAPAAPISTDTGTIRTMGLALLTMGLSSTTRANHKTVFAAYFENWISEDRGGFEVPTRFECSLPER